jgi:hypothetical protein
MYYLLQTPHWFQVLLVCAEIGISAVLLVYLLRTFKYSNTTAVLVAVLSLSAILHAGMYSTTGITSTSVNYQIPVMSMLLSLLPIVNTIRTESMLYTQCKLPLKIIALITTGLSTIVAANNEQLIVPFSLIYLCITIYIFVIKRFMLQNIWVRVLLFLQWIILLASYIYMATCPGNRKRYLAESKDHFPGYDKFNMTNKVSLGLKSYILDLYSAYDKIFFTFLVLIILIVCCRTRSLVNASFGILIFMSFFILIPNKIHVFPDNTLDFSRKTSLVIIFSLLLLIYFIYTAFQNRVQKLIASGLFILGIASKVMIGFSPTVWMSGVRTSYIAVCALFAIIVMLVDELALMYNKIEI